MPANTENPSAIGAESRLYATYGSEEFVLRVMDFNAEPQYQQSNSSPVGENGEYQNQRIIAYQITGNFQAPDSRVERLMALIHEEDVGRSPRTNLTFVRDVDFPDGFTKQWTYGRCMLQISAQNGGQQENLMYPFTARCNVKDVQAPTEA